MISFLFNYGKLAAVPALLFFIHAFFFPPLPFLFLGTFFLGVSLPFILMEWPFSRETLTYTDEEIEAMREILERVGKEEGEI
jgi:hypothetical protein